MASGVDAKSVCQRRKPSCQKRPLPHIAKHRYRNPIFSARLGFTPKPSQQIRPRRMKRLVGAKTLLQLHHGVPPRLRVSRKRQRHCPVEEEHRVRRQRVQPLIQERDFPPACALMARRLGMDGANFAACSW